MIPLLRSVLQSNVYKAWTQGRIYCQCSINVSDEDSDDNDDMIAYSEISAVVVLFGYIYIHTKIHISMRIYAYTYMYIHTCMHTYACILAFHAHAVMSWSWFMCISSHLWSQQCHVSSLAVVGLFYSVEIGKHTYTHAHMHTHIKVFSPSESQFTGMPLRICTLHLQLDSEFLWGSRCGIFTLWSWHVSFVQ